MSGGFVGQHVGDLFHGICIPFLGGVSVVAVFSGKVGQHAR
jgi:hypothetical protein